MEEIGKRNKESLVKSARFTANKKTLIYLCIRNKKEKQMKKIFLIIVLALLGFTANAQMINSKTEHQFKVGEYVFECTTYGETLGGGMYEWRSQDFDEIQTLGIFIQNNRSILEKKYGVVIECAEYGRLERYGCYVVFMTVFEHDTFVKNQERKKAREMREAAEKKSRMNSLNNIL